MKKLSDSLENGLAARDVLYNNSSDSSVQFSDEERAMIRGLSLLTAKPIIYAANVDEMSLGDNGESNGHVTKLREYVNSKSHSQHSDSSSVVFNDRVVVVSAQVESELSALEPEEREEFLLDLGIKDLNNIGLPRLIQATYRNLGLLTYFTSGEKETRAWTIKQGMTAQKAAGVIHTDFEKGFIRAETIGYEDFCKYKGPQGAKESGTLRLEGKEYVVQDGDVLLFRFNV